VRDVGESSEERAARRPSDDVFRAGRTTYVLAGGYASRPGAREPAVPGSGNPARGGVIVSDHVYRLSEIVGSSPTSVDEAIRTAIAKAAQTVRNIEWFQTEEIRGQVADGAVAYYQVRLKIGFRVD
jgi:dodecin